MKKISLIKSISAINEGVKICPKCGVNPRLEYHSYCRECKREYDNTFDKANYIYIIVPKYPLYKGEILYYGSTTHWTKRISAHRKNGTTGMNKINEARREGVVYRVILDDNLTRDELYFIEYYLIHQYQLNYGYTPIGNTSDRRELDIEPKRELELIEMVNMIEYIYIEDLENEKYF